MPELKFEGFVHGKGEGAVIGAGGTFLACLGSAGSAGCTGPYCGAALALLIGICGIFGLVGGVAGAVEAPGAAQAAEQKARLSSAFEVREVQQSVRKGIEDAALAAGVQLVILPEENTRAMTSARDYRPLAANGIDTVLETTLTHAGTAGFGINSPSTLYMQVRTRLIDTASNTEKFAADYRHEGRRLDLAGWSKDQARPLFEELVRGYRSLGSHIYDSIFALYPFPDRSMHSAGAMLSLAYGLAPLYPPTRGQLTSDDFIARRFEWYETENLRPTLRWEAFPRKTDIAVAPEDMARVRNVRYDLLVAREENLAPGDVAYRREDLPSAEHALEINLQSNTRYFWTVRARFELDGRTRLTEWSSTHFATRDRITAPSCASYRFRTPN